MNGECVLFIGFCLCSFDIVAKGSTCLIIIVGPERQYHLTRCCQTLVGRAVDG